MKLLDRSRSAHLSGRSRRSASRTVGAGVAATVVLSLSAVAGAAPVAAARPSPYPIENTYKVRGSSSVLTADVVQAGQVTFKLFYPNDLGAHAQSHPIITFGSGTNSSPSEYPALMNQLASWGFVVVATTDGTEASGVEMLQGVDYMLAENNRLGSVFYQELNEAAIGALGHSQGAGGAVNAVTDDPRVKTTVPVGLPDEKFVKGTPEDFFHVEDIRVPVLFLGGAADKFVASPATLTNFYSRIAPGVGAGVGSLKGASHSAITRDGNGFLGYVTAWMRYQLSGDTYARQAFVPTGTTPAEFTVNTAWQNTALKNLS
jgi:pimeloyl-ACP methyl ester carboxylesterase